MLSYWSVNREKHHITELVGDITLAVGGVAILLLRGGGAVTHTGCYRTGL